MHGIKAVNVCTLALGLGTYAVGLRLILTLFQGRCLSK